MTVFIRPEKRICKFCNQEGGYNAIFGESFTKDGVDYTYVIGYYHESCALKNLEKKEEKKENPKKWWKFWWSP